MHTKNNDYYRNRMKSGIGKVLPGLIAPALLAAVFFGFIAVPGAGAKDIELTGMLRSYTGARINESPDIAVAEQTVDITLEGWGNDTGIVVNPYAYVNASGNPEIGVREAYIDLYLPDADLRIGKQAIIWGEAEGAFITDIVSPQDMRSFILADFREIRKGIPAVRLDWYAGPFTIEGIWAPLFVPPNSPDSDSIWYTEPDYSWAPVVPTIHPGEEPSPGIENSEVFGKISYFGSMLNAAVMAGYSWDDLPVMRIERSAGPAVDLYPEYKRYTMVGGTLSTSISSVVLRTEAAGYLNKTFTTTDPANDNGLTKHNQLQALGGLDWNLFGIDMSAQYILQYIHDHSDYLMEDELEHTATFRMQDSYFSDVLTLELFSYVGFDPADALLRPSVTWSFEDGVDLSVGSEIFLGDESGRFGRYGDNTLAYLSANWYF
ncbi:MAG: hypothetical protein K9L68_05060 [Spirochaetales bacterium]|nr:hypothetical protein [Spirochaetales bacterium]MCF7937948.1 hypothetical protein [Spirochaetales bacterium]